MKPSWWLLPLGALALLVALFVFLADPSDEELEVQDHSKNSHADTTVELDDRPIPVRTRSFREFQPGETPGKERGGGSYRILDEEEFLDRLEELGLESSGDALKRLQGQRRDRGAITLVATDEESRPVAEARVFLEPEGLLTTQQHVRPPGGRSPFVQSATTEEDGLANFMNLAPGTYLLSVEHPAFVTFYLASLPVPKGEVTFVEARLEGADAVIAGMVRAEDKGPLGEVEISATRYVEGGAPFVANARSSADGRFRLEVQKDAQYELEVTRPGYKDQRLSGIVAGREDLEITLESTPTALVSGRVVDGASGEAIPVFTIGNRSFTHPDGQFRLELNQSAEVAQRLDFSAEGYGPRVVQVSVSSSEGVDLGNVPLYARRSLSGLVLTQSSDGPTPLSGAVVSLVVGSAAPRTTTTGAAGAFSFADISEAEARVSVTAAGYQPQTRELSLLADRPSYLEFTLLPLGSGGGSGSRRAMGTLIDADSGDPLPGVEIRFVGELSVAAVTDLTGSFDVTGVPELPFQLAASRAGYHELRSPILDARSGPAHWNGQLVPSGLRVRLRRAGAAPPAGTNVVLWKKVTPTLAAAQAAQADLSNHRWEGVTATNGNVNFDVPAGDYFVQVPDFRLHPTAVSHDPQNAAAFEIPLPGVTTLSGRIRFHGGAPVANTSLWLHSGDQDYSTMFLYHTDAEGNYSIPNLAPRPYALSIIKSSSVQSAQHLVPFVGNGQATQTLNVTFPALTASLSGRIVDANGQGRGGIHVGVEYLDAPHRSILAGWVQTAPDGSYLVPLLEAGNHRLRTAWTAGASVFSEVIPLVAGQQRTLDLIAPVTTGRHLRGHLIAADGGPLGPNFLFARDSQGRENGNYFSLMQWGYVGSFDVGSLAPDHYILTATAMGCRKKQLNANASGGDQSGILITMDRE